MAGIRRCGGCGADLAAGADECTFCGAANAAAVVPIASPPGAPDTSRERFDAMRRHPSFADAVRDVPPTPAILGLITFFPVFVGAVFIVVSIVIAVVGGGALATESKAISAVAAIFPLLFCGIGVLVIVGSLRRRRKMLGDARTAEPAVVIAKRAETAQNGTSYYVTLRLESGERREFGVLGDVFRSAFEGDAGVAHCRGELLLGLRKIAI